MKLGAANKTILTVRSLHVPDNRIDLFERSTAHTRLKDR